MRPRLAGVFAAFSLLFVRGSVMAVKPFRTRGRAGGGRRFQFGLAALLFLTVPVALLAGAWAALNRSKPGEPMHLLGLVLVAAAPIALAIATSLARAARRRSGRRG